MFIELAIKGINLPADLADINYLDWPDTNLRTDRRFPPRVTFAPPLAPAPAPVAPPAPAAPPVPAVQPLTQWQSLRLSPQLYGVLLRQHLKEIKSFEIFFTPELRLIADEQRRVDAEHQCFTPDDTPVQYVDAISTALPCIDDH